MTRARTSGRGRLRNPTSSIRPTRLWNTSVPRITWTCSAWWDSESGRFWKESAFVRIATPQQLRRRDSSKRVKLPGEVRLIVIAAGERKIREGAIASFRQTPHGAGEPHDSREGFGPDTQLALEFAREMPLAPADVADDGRDRGLARRLS